MFDRLMLVTVLALVSLTIAGNVPCATVDVESRSGEAISVLATKPPTVEEIKECSTHVFADHGACCLDCQIPFHLSRTGKKQICNCPIGRSYLRYQYYKDTNCYPFYKINMTTSIFSLFDLADMEARKYASMVVESCKRQGCQCIDIQDRSIQPIYAYDSLPIGLFGDPDSINQFQALTKKIADAASAGVFSKQQQVLIKNVTDQLLFFYTSNGIGNLTATQGADIKKLPLLISAIKKIESAAASDKTITKARSELFDSIVLFAISETQRFARMFKQMMAEQKDKLNFVLAGLLKSTLDGVTGKSALTIFNIIPGFA